METKNYCKCIAMMAGMALLFSACTKKVIPNDPSQNKNPDISQELKDFGFTTRGDVRLTVNYDAPGFDALIEVYDVNPLDNTKEKIEGIEPIYAFFTDTDSKFSGNIFIPKAVKEAYLYTNRWGLPRCVKLDLTEKTLSYDASKTKVKSSGTKAPYDYIMGDVQPYPLKSRTDGLMTLGRFDESGRVFYSNGNDGSESTDYTPNYTKKITHIGGSNIAQISKRAQAYFDKFNGKQHEMLRPAELTNVKVKKEGTVDIMFLTQKGDYLNTFGYYYYPAGSPPSVTDFETMKKYVIAPAVDLNSTIQSTHTIRLKYFGANGTEVATEKFPANTVIGWFIISNGWNKSSAKIKRWEPTGGRNFYFSNDTGDLMRFISMYDKESGALVLGCEDHEEKIFNKPKEDFADLLFFVKSDDGAIDYTDKPIIDDDKPTIPDNGIVKLSGILAFEDIWPAGGDYDMNDVAIKYDRIIFFNTVNKVTTVQETFQFVHRDLSAKLDSYFGCQYNNMGSFIAAPIIQNETATGSFIYSVSTRESVGKVFSIKRTLQELQTVDAIAKDFNPYIIVGHKGENRIEVHLPGKTPTSMVNQSLINTSNDSYYMRKDGQYPFAIDIPRLDFMLSNEARSIDKSYPRFKTWANSLGKVDADWYTDSPVE